MTDPTSFPSAAHPLASTSPRALWSAIGGLTFTVAALAGTLLYQHRQSEMPAMSAVRPVVAPAVVSGQKTAVTPAPPARTAIDSIAGRRVPAPPVAFATAPVRAPATLRPASPRG